MSAEHSSCYYDMEQYSASKAIDLDTDTFSIIDDGEEPSPWIRINFDQVIFTFHTIFW